MAKKKKTSKAAKKTPKKFLAEIASDPAKLGRFIHDPEGLMDELKVPKQHRVHIRNAIAQEVHKRLAPTPEAYLVFMC
jgi:hypothetical protein